MNSKKILLKEFDDQKIRSFSVIAHIDHGKSTLCNRLLEITGTLSKRQKTDQFLDKLQVEREKSGITVKAQTATMFYKYSDNKYMLNLKCSNRINDNWRRVQRESSPLSKKMLQQSATVAT